MKLKIKTGNPKHYKVFLQGICFKYGSTNEPRPCKHDKIIFDHTKHVITVPYGKIPQCNKCGQRVEQSDISHGIFKCKKCN